MSDNLASFRFKSAAATCPVCGGHDRLSRESGRRCGGYLSSDGKYACCTSRHHAGGLVRSPSGTFSHALTGPCRCGLTHAAQLPGKAVVSGQALNASPERKIIKVYDYTDEKDQLLYQVVRYEPKGFCQRRPARPGESSKDGWVYRVGEVRKVLYRLPELVKADLKTPVFIVEGEKDVETLRAHGFVATCNPMGAGKWREEYNRFLAGRRVVVIADNDEPGRQHAAELLAGVYRVAQRVCRLDLPGEVKDISEWFGVGHNKDELLSLLAEAAPWQKRAGEANPLTKLVNAKTLVAKEFEPVRWIVPQILPEGTSILAARPKVGKSWMALNLALAVAMGGVALGRQKVEGGEVLYLALEDNERRLKGRLTKMLQDKAAPERLYFATDWPRSDEGGCEALEQWLKTHPQARLVVVDTLAKFRPPVGATHNLYEADYGSMQGLKRLSDLYRVALLVVHHTRKGQSEDPLEDVSGSTGLTAGVDNVLALRRKRGEAGGVLHLIGRDIESEEELAVTFDKELALWITLGPAREHALSEERREIVELLAEYPHGLRPAEIARNLNKQGDAVRQLLRTMLREGQIHKDETERYRFSDHADHGSRFGATDRPADQTPHSFQSEALADHGDEKECERDPRDSYPYAEAKQSDQNKVGQFGCGEGTTLFTVQPHEGQDKFEQIRAKLSRYDAYAGLIRKQTGIEGVGDILRRIEVAVNARHPDYARLLELARIRRSQIWGIGGV
jgi:hypothetical protein